MLLKIYRIGKDLTQEEIADYLGISKRQYQRIETGNSFPRKEIINDLEDLFELPQRVLLAKSVEEVPEYLKQYTHKV